MKRLSILLLCLASAALAQFQNVPATSYPVLENILNAKPAMTMGTGAPISTCTTSKDFYLDTAASVVYFCSATNAWTAMPGIMSGSTAPNNTVGVNGSFFLQTSDTCLWGPKASGAWPGSCTSLVGPQGTQGPQGTPGTQGTQGIQGTAGTNGTNGNTVLNGALAPTSGQGANGDFFLNTATACLYGPKAAGAWPGSCTSLVGPPGSGGSLSVDSNGTVVGSRATLNYVAGVGVQNSITDTGTQININQSADTAVVATRATVQGGSDTYAVSASASGSAYTASMTGNPLSALTAGMVIRWKPDVAGAGGTTTLNVNTLGATPVKEWDGATNPTSADIVAAKIYPLTYDGTNFRLPYVPRQTCTVIVGADNGTALANADLGPQLKQCKISKSGTVLQVSVASDAGTPSVTVGRRRCTTFTAGVCTVETAVNLTSAALSTAAGGFDACTLTAAGTALDGGTTCSGTLQNTSLTQGDWLELETGTAGGTAKRVSVAITWQAVN